MLATNIINILIYILNNFKIYIKKYHIKKNEFIIIFLNNLIIYIKKKNL